MKTLICLVLLTGVGLAENKALQPNLDSAPIRIAWADTRVKGSAMFQLVPGRVPDLVALKFKNSGAKPVQIVERGYP